MLRTAVLYEGPTGTRIDRPEVTVVGTTRDELVALALTQVGGGAKRVELCGALGAADHAEVAAALGPDVPVGLNRYAFESLELITDYKRAFAAGEMRPSGFIVLAPGADPGRDRVEHQGSTFVPVPDVDSVGAAAAELAAGGVGLIELYAGLGASAGSHALAATGGRVPIGVTGYDG